MNKSLITAKKRFDMTSKFRKVSSDLKKVPLLNLLYLSFLVALISIVGVLTLQKFLPPEVPVYYGLAEGENQLGSTLELVIPGAVTLLIIIVNLTITSLIQNQFLKQTLIAVSFMASLLTIINIIKIVLLIGNF